MSSLIDFIQSDKHTICLTGSSGSGKSLVINMLYDILDDNRISCSFVTPTNKSKIVLLNKGGYDRAATTIHSLLNLRPNLNILDFDATQLVFDFIKPKVQDFFKVLIVDECSMINDELYDTLLDRYSKSKILFVGDAKQLFSVKQNHISKPFLGECVGLTTVHRQKDSVLLKVLNYLRDKPIYKFKSVSDEHSNIIVYHDIKEMLDNHAALFKIAVDLDDLSLVKLVTYTNKRLTALNQYIRKLIYPPGYEYYEGEILTGYDSCDYLGPKNHIDNSMDYKVERVRSDLFEDMPAYTLFLKSETGKCEVKILSRNVPDSKLEKLADRIEKLRLKAIKTKRNDDWRAFFKLYNSFLLPKDLYLGDRCIKRKSLDYGYCVSAHKSQSCTLRIVMVDMENLFLCPNKEELRQLQYVACSRTMSDLIIYQK